jgi:hypothetical protein
MGAAAAIAIMRMKERPLVDDFRALMIGSALALILIGLAIGFLKW